LEKGDKSVEEVMIGVSGGPESEVADERMAWSVREGVCRGAGRALRVWAARWRQRHGGCGRTAAARCLRVVDAAGSCQMERQVGFVVAAGKRERVRELYLVKTVGQSLKQDIVSLAKAVEAWQSGGR